jgi:hypothetical protein
MTTTTIATAAGPILAIDLGKYKSVACLVRSADERRNITFRSGRAERETKFRIPQHSSVTGIDMGGHQRGRTLTGPAGCPLRQGTSRPVRPT